MEIVPAAYLAGVAHSESTLLYLYMLAWELSPLPEQERASMSAVSTLIALEWQMHCDGIRRDDPLCLPLQVPQRGKMALTDVDVLWNFHSPRRSFGDLGKG